MATYLLTIVESDTKKFDLTIPFSRQFEKKTLHVAIFTTSDSVEMKGRLHVLIPPASSPPPYVLIVVVDDLPGFVPIRSACAFAELQMLYAWRSPRMATPAHEGYRFITMSKPPSAIIVPSPEQILPHLETYVEVLCHPVPPPQNPMCMPTQLLAHTTAAAPGQPLSEHDANVLSDLFPSMRALEEATRTTQGKAVIREYFDSKTAANIIDFWENEWIA